MAPLKSVLLLVSLLLSIASAAKTVSYTADFENTGGTADTPLGSLQSGQPPPKPYYGLNYERVVLARNNDMAISQLHTPSGAVWVVNPIPNLTPYITKGPNVVSFDMTSALAGCAAGTGNGEIANPVNCTMLFTGTRADGTTVTKAYDYVATTDRFAFGISNKIELLTQVAFGSAFRGLSRFDAVPIDSAVDPFITSIGLDRFVYTVKTN